MEPLEVRALLAGEFTDLGALGIASVYGSSVAWGDMDNDGDLDILLTGFSTSGGGRIAKVYRNDANITFTDINAGLTGVKYGAVAWGDMDNDGDLDILLAGEDSTFNPIAKVYRNNGNSTFSDLNAGLTGSYQGAAAWGDMDNDGDLDILLTGADSTLNSIAKVYRNNGNSTFTDIGAGLAGVDRSSAAWGDMDSDGDLDILLTGFDNTNTRIAKVYRNNGNSTFTDLNAGLTGVADGSVAWGDMDNDGDLDILITGRDDTGTWIPKVYRNNGNSTFTNLNSGLNGGYHGSIALGDMDNDGDLDILLTGRDNNFANSATVYRNNGNSTFTDINAGLTGVDISSAEWGDMDSDGDLDILLTGKDSSSRGKVYRNNALTVNTPPGVPTNLAAGLASASSLTFSWTAPTDSQTPAAGLSYNLRVGTTPGGSDVFSTMASSANGKRRLPDAGPIQGTSYTLKLLTPSLLYYWSVQAIDTAFAGGAFAPEVVGFAFTELGSLGPGATSGTTAWGDMDNDGDLDVLITGRDTGTTVSAKVYRNNGNGTYSEINAGLTGTVYGSAAWGDMDEDGDLDIVLTGRDSTNTSIAKVYRNNGNSTFTDLNAGLTGVEAGQVAWGDMDNDGDLDILLTGRVGNDPYAAKITRIYRNNGNNTFTDINAGLPGVYVGAVAWGDVDRDGDLDLLLAGFEGQYSLISRIYRNNGNSTFTDLNAGLTTLGSGSAAWGDMDNDGDLDLLFTGQDSSFVRSSKVYRNNGNNTFTDLNAGLTGVFLSAVAWGDSDNDGDLDILLTGRDSASAKIARIYRNNGNSTFTGLNTALIGVDYSAVAFGDADNDGDLDVLLSGLDATSVRVTRIYRNNTLIVNTPPAAPPALYTSGVSATALTFSWTASTDTRTPSAALSYNLRVGTSPGASNVFSTMASTVNGKRRLPDRGPLQGNNFTLKGLTSGQTYYWSVQAIDSSLAGSAFASEQISTPGTNSAPFMFGTAANQPVNDNASISPFASLWVVDSNNQNMFARVTILNGVVRGDFTPASATGWTRTVSGNDIKYERFYNPAANIGSIVQAAIRAFVFVPRINAIKPNTTEATAFSIFVNDGLASATNSTTTVITTSVNNAPTLGGTTANLAVNDNATVNPFIALTVNDADNQEMLISVTILNGLFRGDFTAASTSGWAVRYTTGNDITYKRYFSPQANVGAAAQAAFRALVFQPRTNAIKPGTTEATDFQVTVSDGVAPAVLGTGTRVTTTSVNNAPTIGGAVANQTMNDNQTKAVFSTLTVTDPDTQDQFVRVTITNGTARGDLTAASTIGWTRKVSGANILYERFFAAVNNNGLVVQTAIRALVFQPRTNVPVGTQETTSFTVFVNDGIANATNSTTSVNTTGVAPRLPTTAVTTTPIILLQDIETIVIPSIRRPVSNPLARLLKKAR